MHYLFQPPTLTGRGLIDALVLKKDVWHHQWLEE
jgi:hypothetical protein